MSQAKRWFSYAARLGLERRRCFPGSVPLACGSSVPGTGRLRVRSPGSVCAVTTKPGSGQPSGEIVATSSVGLPRDSSELEDTAA